MVDNDLITKTIKVVNEALSKFAQMNCVEVWRSIGSNVFFEFGMPIIKRVSPKKRKPFTVVRGEVALGIHADSWYLRAGPNRLLSSDTADDGNLFKVARALLLGKPMPKFGVDADGALTLLFGSSISVRIENNIYPDDADSHFDEVSVNLAEVGFRFNYRRGFYIVP